MINAIKLRLKILRINTENSYKIQTAYFFENFASLGSTFFYTITLYLLIKIIYSNIDLYAGYSENDTIFLLLLAQINYYVDMTWSTNNILSMIDSVRFGELDFVLTKPVPSLFFVTFKDISLVNRLRDGVPNLILLAMLIDWSQINTDFIKISTGIVLFVLGQIAWHCFRFIFSLPVFFLGNSSEIYQISAALNNRNDIPYEGYTNKLRLFFSSVVPTLIAAQISASVILGKSDPIMMLGYALIVTSIFVYLKIVAWNLALKNYSSASS